VLLNPVGVEMLLVLLIRALDVIGQPVLEKVQSFDRQRPLAALVSRLQFQGLLYQGVVLSLMLGGGISSYCEELFFACKVKLGVMFVPNQGASVEEVRRDLEKWVEKYLIVAERPSLAKLGR